MEEAGTYGKPQGMKQIHLDMHGFQVKNLSEQEIDGLFQTYGFRIADIEALNEGEEWLFSEQEILSPKFYIQTLYKVKGSIVPEVFTTAAEKLVKELPILRTNFYKGNGRMLKVVLKEHTPVILYRSLGGKRAEEIDTLLENIMEADRRRDFDLRQDRLLRIAVFRTAKEECAVLVTQPQVIAAGWDVHQLFREVMEIPGRGMTEPHFSFADYLKQKEAQKDGPALAYWKKLLANLPDIPVLPGYRPSYQPYQQEVTRLRLSLDDMQSLREKGRGEKNFMMAILQTAWGIMLQQVNHTEDTYFCLLLANRQARLDNIAATAAMVDMIPVRIVCEPSSRMETIAQQLLRQVIVSQPYGYCRRQEFQQIIGRQQNAFNHFLSFHGFLTDVRRYSMTAAVPEGRAVAMNSLDAQGMDLGVYFRYDGETIAVEFLYHEKCFTKAGICALADRFAFTFHKLLECWERSVFFLKHQLHETQLANTLVAGEEAELAAEEVLSFLRQTDIFRNLDRNYLERLASTAKIRHCFKNDTIERATGGRQLWFVMRGKAVRNLDAGNGWYSMLDVLGEKHLLNPYAFMPTAKVRLLVEVLTEQAVFLSVPLEAVRAVMGETSAVGQNLTDILLKELIKYQRYWLLG